MIAGCCGRCGNVTAKCECIPVTPPEAMTQRFGSVQGYCPMGCGRTLFLGSGGYITCSLDKCPNPTALADLLEDPEHEHIVVLEDSTFSIEHPLRERLNGVLFKCPLHAFIQGHDGPPLRPGRYRVRQRGDDRFSWEPLP